MEIRIITEVMEEEGLYPDDIPNESGVNPAKLEQVKRSCRYFQCKAFASYDKHVGRQRTWKSAHALCILDLKEQCVTHCWSRTNTKGILILSSMGVLPENGKVCSADFLIQILKASVLSGSDSVAIYYQPLLKWRKIPSFLSIVQI